MSFSQNLEENSLRAEELLTPPKIDIIGFSLISLLSLIVGFLGGIFVVTLIFLFFGTFSFESGISPVLLAMITFFALSFSNFIFLWGITNIFSQVYTRSRTFFVQVSIFSAILYIVILPFYISFASDSTNTNSLFFPYQIHILLNLFGFFILIGLISYYRYSILNFYASIISLVITGTILYFISRTFTVSGSAIFNLLWSIALSFFIFTVSSFSLIWAYRFFYNSLWIDPVWNVFDATRKDEIELEKEAEKALLKQ